MIAVGEWQLLESPHQALRQRLREGQWSPATDVYTSGEAVILKMELAGVAADSIDLTAEGRVLRIRGVRPQECPGPECEYRQAEIRYGQFERAFEFTFPLTDAALDAQYRDGLLIIRVEPPREVARRIAIQSDLDG